MANTKMMPMINTGKENVHGCLLLGKVQVSVKLLQKLPGICENIRCAASTAALTLPESGCPCKKTSVDLLTMYINTHAHEGPL